MWVWVHHRYGKYRFDPDVIKEDLAYFQEHQGFDQEDELNLAASKLQAYWRGYSARKAAEQAIENEIRELEALERQKMMVEAEVLVV